MDKFEIFVLIGCGVALLWAMTMLTVITLKAVGLY